MVNRLFIDIETYSSISLKDSGLYVYSESEDFEVMLVAYSIDGGEVSIVDIAMGETLPEEIVEAIKNPKVIKYAFNAAFERVCLGVHLGEQLQPEGWQCLMVSSLYVGLPKSLAKVGEALELDRQKLEEGEELIQYFCVPYDMDADENFLRNLPKDNMKLWESFKKYCVRDVETAVDIWERVSKIEIPDSVWQQYCVDQRINDRGVSVNIGFAEAAIEIDEKIKEECWDRAVEITGLDNPNSPVQLIEWLEEQLDVEIDSLTKSAVNDLMDIAEGEVRETLLLRQQMGKTSNRKYDKILDCVCNDGRIRGTFQYYGAHSGRWTGKLVQAQNLPKTDDTCFEARDMVEAGKYEKFVGKYGRKATDVLSKLIRTAFVPEEGKKFIVADYSAIEARVLAWISKEKWKEEVFAEGSDLYCATASKMFGVPVEKNGVNGELRAKGKIAELALGYGGAAGAIKNMGASDLGLEDKAIKDLVKSWRAVNPNIVDLWWQVDACAKNAIKRKYTKFYYNGLEFEKNHGILFIGLPSGRKLAYCKPAIENGPRYRDIITYKGVEGTSKKWTSIKTYGPKLVENIVQGIARDLLAEAMKRLEEAGFCVVMHIHDEVVIEASMEQSLEEVCKIMCITPEWAKGLLLNAEGFESEYYKKE